MKNSNKILTVGYLLLLAGASYADTNSPSPQTKELKDEKQRWSADLAFITDYVIRGLTQTEHHPALQATFIYFLPYNFHLDFFTSNVRFPENATWQEIDTGIGYTIPLSHDNAFNLIYTHYTYPKSRAFNYNELLFTFATGPLSWQGAYSLNVDNSHHPGLYLAASAKHEFPAHYCFGLEGIQGQFTLGHDWLPKQAGHNYTQIEAGFEKDIDSMSYSLIFGTTHPKRERQHLVFTAQYNFAG